MPPKYHIHTSPVAARFQAITKSGVIAWEEGCLKCAVAVKKDCVYKVTKNGALMPARCSNPSTASAWTASAACRAVRTSSSRRDSIPHIKRSETITGRPRSFQGSGSRRMQAESRFPAEAMGEFLWSWFRCHVDGHVRNSPAYKGRHPWP